MCTYSVRAILQRDRTHSLYFAPLQGVTAKRLLDRELRQDLATVIYLPENSAHAYLRSDAVLHALIDIHSRWRFLAKLLLRLPQKARDSVYNVVARNRFRITQKTCRQPLSDQIRTRLLT